jgi:hypothetical protein
MPFDCKGMACGGFEVLVGPQGARDSSAFSIRTGLKNPQLAHLLSARGFCLSFMINCAEADADSSLFYKFGPNDETKQREREKGSKSSGKM